MNFNNTLRGMLTLFIFQSKEGWFSLMWNSVDAVDVDQQPIKDSNQFYIIVFMILVVLLCLLFVNMFIGVVIETYQSEKESMSFNNHLTERQRSWLQLQNMSYHVKPVPRIVPGKNIIRIACIKITQHKYFERFIMVSICLNTFVLTLNWLNEPDALHTITFSLNLIFMGIFTLEAIIKLIAMQKAYF